MIDDIASRVLSRSDRQPNGCILWRGALSKGYGQIGVKGKNLYVHRVTYEAAKGPIPAGLCIDHLCRTPRCVNPDHLEAVTVTENNLRGVGFAAQNSRKTHCRRGHELNETSVWLISNMRHCKQCQTLRQRQRRAALRAAGLTSNGKTPVRGLGRVRR